MTVVRAATAGVDPRFVAMVRDLVLERAAAERGEQPVRAAVGLAARRPGRVRRRLLPQPARSAPGPVRARLVSDRGRRWRCATWPVAVAREGAALARGCGDERHRRGRHQVERDRRRDRGRPRRRGAAPRAAARSSRPDDAILGEEGDDHPGTSGVRWVVDPIDGTVNYLYGLPDCAVSVAAEVDGELVAGAVVGHPAERRVRRRARATAPPATAARSRVRPTPPLAERLVLTGFGYQRDGARAPGRPASPGCCRRCATSAGWARAPSTCATSPTAARTPTSRRGRSRGTGPRAGSCCARRAVGSTSSTAPWTLDRAGRARRRGRRRRPTAGTPSSRRSGTTGFLA